MPPSQRALSTDSTSPGLVQVEDDSLLEGEVQETGHVDEHGQLVRPWCPATRVLEQQEAEAEAAAAEAKRRAAQEAGAGLLGAGEREPPPRTGFPELAEGKPVYQKNEGGWAWVHGRQVGGGEKTCPWQQGSWEGGPCWARSGEGKGRGGQGDEAGRLGFRLQSM